MFVFGRSRICHAQRYPHSRYIYNRQHIQTATDAIPINAIEFIPSDGKARVRILLQTLCKNKKLKRNDKLLIRNPVMSPIPSGHDFSNRDNIR